MVGRVTGPPVARELPSGDQVVTLRVTVERPTRRHRASHSGPDNVPHSEPARRQVDAIDLACWSPRTRGAAMRLVEEEVIEVRGALRRRFYKAGPATVSRYEIEVEQLGPA